LGVRFRVWVRVGVNKVRVLIRVMIGVMVGARVGVSV